MKTKRDKVDTVFSQLVRMRANWKCERCKKDFSDNKRALHCSHFYSRRKRGVRFYPRNAAAHCFSCHQTLGENPCDFAEWVEEYVDEKWGEEAFQELHRRQRAIFRMKKEIKEAIYKKLKWALAQMEEQRNNGVKGWLDFDSPYED